MAHRCLARVVAAAPNAGCGDYPLYESLPIRNIVAPRRARFFFEPRFRAGERGFPRPAAEENGSGAARGGGPQPDQPAGVPAIPARYDRQPAANHQIVRSQMFTYTKE